MDNVIGAVKLDQATLDAIEYLKNDDETVVGVMKRGFMILLALQKQLDEGYTQVFLRNPETRSIKRMRIVDTGEDSEKENEQGN